MKLEAVEVRTEARFGLSGQSYLLGPVFEAEIGLIMYQIGPTKLLQKRKKVHLALKTWRLSR